jgi:AcrR family transcriptional regulator
MKKNSSAGDIASGLLGTRAKLREAALHLFVEKGVGETSVRDIVHAIGVTEGTLYRHYLSKDDLIKELFISHYAAFAHRLSNLLAGHKGFAARLAAIIAEFCRFYDEEPTLFRFLLLVQHQALPQVANDENNPVEVLERFISEAIDKKEIRLADPALGAAMLLGLLLQPATAALYGRIGVPLSSYAETMTKAARAALEFKGE